MPFTIDVVVKFTDRYSADAHNFMARRKLAAPLRFCELETDIVVISDHLENAKDVTLTADGYYKLFQALVDLHAENMVYGDLRAPNLMLSKNGSPSLVDYDWARPIGSSTYSHNLNLEDDAFPRDAAGREIKPADDLYMLAKYKLNHTDL